MADSSLKSQLEPRLFENLKKRLDADSSEVDAFSAYRDLFLSEFDLPLQAIGIASRSDWISLHPRAFKGSSKRPSFEQIASNNLVETGGLLWYPVRDHLGLLGVFVLDECDIDSETRQCLDLVGPPLISYFRRLEHYESASGREELVFPQRDLMATGASDDGLGLEDIFQSSVESISRIFECDNCRLFWLESPEILRLRAESPSSEDLESELIVSNDPVIRKVIEDGKSIMINDVPEAEETLQQSANIRSFLSVPISVDGQIKGAINLSSQAPEVYTKQDLQHFSALCDHLSTVYASTQELVDLTRYVDKVMQNLPVGVLTYRIRRDDIHLNDEARQILDIEKENMDRADFEEFVGNRFLDENFRELFAIDDTLDDRPAQNYRMKDDTSETPRILKAYRNSIRDSEDLLSGILVVISEITEQVRLNEQVNRTERLAALGELASSLAHEIKNPLTSIQGFIQMLPGRADDREFIEKTADILGRECQRLDELIENLHSYAKPQVGQRKEFDLSQLVDETLTLLRKQAEKSDVDISVEVPDDLRLYGDSSKIKQAIMNLALNALEAMKDGGKFELECNKTRDDYVRMVFSDTGVGMEGEELERIFNPFYTTKEEGTGLGMAITHRIVQDHGGLLSIESTPGEGTTVEVLLPRRETTPPIEGSS